jgi:signal transduction histidine kinase
VIHDFKTPMTIISGHAQLMVDADDRAERQEHSEAILKQFDVLTAMQREVLDFARGKSTLFVRRVYLKKFLGELERQIRLEVDDTPVELVINADSKLVARFDEARVARALHNLARNAIEAMGERGGRLEIGAALVDGELVLTVSDTGPGIPAEVEGRMFQSFVTSGKRDGTGLGLAIVRKIVEEHGGRVDVASDSKGTVFTLSLPQAPPEPGVTVRAREGSS